MNAIVLMSFCVGNVIGPETFRWVMVDSTWTEAIANTYTIIVRRAEDAPQYIPAKITIVAFMCAGILLTIALDLLYARENKKRDREGEVDMPRNYEFLDLSDKQNQNFRYCL
jgi:hypothetical protein